jgi:1-acyl-sn-glycerol-3-phosphate acyltransferase
MSNHESHFDAVVMMAITDVPLRFVARHNLFYLPVLGWAMWANGHIPVRRDCLRKAYNSLQRAGELLAQGSRVLIFPEGSRAAGAELLSFKQGGFLLAIDGGVPIIPVGVAGTREVCPKGWHWAGRGPVSVVVGDPLSPEGLSRKDRSSFVQLVRQRITELRDDARRLNLASEVRELPHTIGTQTERGIDLQ